MNVYSVRSIVEFAPRASTKKRHLYEERITLWKAASFSEAIRLAFEEVALYAKEEIGVLSLSQAFQLYDGVSFEGDSAEVFSLLRESDLEPEEYLTTFFDTGHEKNQGA